MAGVPVLALVLLLATACGSGDPAPPGSLSPTTVASPPTTGAPAATATTSPASAVPDTVVRDVATGADVKIRALGLADRPTLYWFWAPH